MSAAEEDFEEAEGAERLDHDIRLDYLLEEGHFYDAETISAQTRLKLLENRWSAIPGYQALRAIPALEHECFAYERVAVAACRPQETPSAWPTSDIERGRTAARLYLAAIREQVRYRFQVSDLLSYTDVIKENVLPDIIPNLAVLGAIFRPKRPLAPPPVKPHEDEPATSEKTRIVVTVQQAADLFLPALLDKPSESPLRPFVEVCFSRWREHTNVSSGENPIWNEELSFDFAKFVEQFKGEKACLTPSDLEEITEVLYINLYNYSEKVVTTSTSQHETVQEHTIWRQPIGSLEIPFYTIYINGSIEGTFYVPLMETLQTVKEVNSRPKLSVFIKFDPPVKKPEAPREVEETMETAAVFEAANNFLKKVRMKFPESECKVLVANINIKQVLLQRYLCEMAPPKELLTPNDLDNNMIRVARYVALIPFVSDIQTFGRMCDVWNTCDQFLAMLCGDEEEHAVLLLNYFLALNVEAWLVFGQAIPEGATTYVLTRREIFHIWDSKTGQRYDLTDGNAPLRCIDALASPIAVHANMQTNRMPTADTLKDYFALDSSSKWLKFTTPDVSTVQPDQSLDIYYSELVPDRECFSLAAKLESEIKYSFMMKRPRHVTSWPTTFRRPLERYLNRLEEYKMRNEPHGPDSFPELTDLNGFTMNFGYSDTATIVRAVTNTAVWDVPEDDVEFALAVMVKSYPAAVLSIWVYVGVSRRRRRA